jgi:hypothetical protein
VGHEWPGTDEAQIALEDVPELRQLIDAPSPQEPANPSHTLSWGKNPTIRAALGAHGSKLDDLEWPLVSTDSDLPKEDWTPHASPDRHRHDGEHWCKRDQPGEGGT